MVEFHHSNHRGDYLSEISGTIALDLVPKKDLELVFSSHANKTIFLAGMTIKSPKDPFIKSKGRLEAVAKMKPTVFTFLDVCVLDTKHIYTFISDYITVNRIRYKMKVRLSTVAESEKVRLIKGGILLHV